MVDITKISVHTETANHIKSLSKELGFTQRETIKRAILVLAVVEAARRKGGKGSFFDLLAYFACKK